MKTFEFIAPLSEMLAFEQFIFLRQLKTLKQEGFELIHIWDIPGMYDEYDIDNLIEVYTEKCKKYPYTF